MRVFHHHLSRLIGLEQYTQIMVKKKFSGQELWIAETVQQCICAAAAGAWEA
jgi:hypothetical protein